MGSFADLIAADAKSLFGRQVGLCEKTGFFVPRNEIINFVPRGDEGGMRTRAAARPQWLLCAWLAVVALPAVAGAGWTEDDLWSAEMKLDELRDAVADQVGARREVWACAWVPVHHVCARARVRCAPQVPALRPGPLRARAVGADRVTCLPSARRKNSSTTWRRASRASRATRSAHART